uniref:Maltase glucoamylase n=1 Tax=Anopheles coluzzii TaxID=1518534 RepID=A0A8W7PMM7_ANOCL|nr:myogenesis-regulating glycosidase isoform X1 [Anopheles coluzzii]XP_040225042.2 myogenesis-regulating glycosidase isoform X1 [Anopheles coluzzii]XP_040225043.2 myogenesis-regulating glycosidase isoform X1 [Anopheles coluzzii]XP_040225044.2 myogenesis-regulating glycosidase isoform X1 [Anopheles coluzzii]XP_040225045.2 myogenesis-regulating glycosidase isoform X1 [Anopheles coluzzii]XP_049461997.1 myogenesis-regulating glycosidase isoform X1 [Anopheles coluzzii]
MHKGATTDEPHGTSRQGHGRQSKAGVPIEKENIPFVDSDHEDECFDDGGDRLAAAISSRSTVDQEYDIMTESQENLARAYITGRNAAGPSLAERRMQEKLTVSIDTSSNDGDLIEEARDKATELKLIDERARGLRRNSISLPSLNVNELEVLRSAHECENGSKISVMESGSDSLSDGTTVTPETPTTPANLKPMLQFNDDSSSDEDDKRRSKNLFRTKRRSSIAPLPALRLNDKEMMSNDFDTHSVLSNQASITSVNSLASLLKEKMQNVPAIIRKKKRETKDYKLRVFVGMLFLIIVFLVGYAYVMYNQKLLAKSYFESIKFHKKTRNFRLLDGKGGELLTGVLGTSLNIEQPYNCLPKDLKDDGSVCYEWNSKARLYMNLAKSPGPDIKCYSFQWESLLADLYPTDCFDVSEERGFWYGGGLTKGIEYILGKATIPAGPFVTGDINMHQWGNALKRYFLNSRGVAIQVDEKTPLYVSVNTDSGKRLCLQGKNDKFAFVNQQTRFPELKYTVCSGPDMKTLHNGLMQKSLWDGLTERDNDVIKSLLREPVWQIPASKQEDLTEVAIYNYTESIIALGYLRLGHVLVNEFWQRTIGDFRLDSERFPTLDETVNILHRRGFRVSFMIQPFISTESSNFREAVAKKLLIFERESERSIPALTRYKSTTSAGVLDVTNNASIPWLAEQLKKISETVEIDSYFVDFGTAFNIPRYYQCSQTLVNPDEYKNYFMERFEGTLSIFGVSSAISVPRPPAFLSLPPVNSSWSGLQSIIPTMLSYGIIGFPFLMPGPVGGDFVLPTQQLKKMYSYYSFELPPLPDKELYIRWLQLATFLPVLRFTHLPSEYRDETVTVIAKELADIRQRVLPLLERFSSIAMDEGLPIIRPLWMLDSTDVNCFSIDDEFSIGDGMIVAPVLKKGETVREVYLPQGVWKDGIDESLRKGSRWIHNYHVPQNKVAYFIKMPDNTRF